MNSGGRADLELHGLEARLDRVALEAEQALRALRVDGTGAHPLVDGDVAHDVDAVAGHQRHAGPVDEVAGEQVLLDEGGQLLVVEVVDRPVRHEPMVAACTDTSANLVGAAADCWRSKLCNATEDARLPVVAEPATSSASTNFDRTIGSRPIAGRPGELSVRLDPGWSSLVGVHGGYLCAIAVHAAESLAPGRTVRTLSTSFLRTAQVGTATLTVRECGKAGRRPPWSPTWCRTIGS